MRKTVWRFFAGFLEAEEKWLNVMADKGYRLLEVGPLSYTFASCQKGAYQYAVEFVAHQSDHDARTYQAFLEEMGYRVWAKNINLNLSVGKLRLRPYGKGWGKLAVSGQNYGRELLIVEKVSDGRPFALHTDKADLISYYKYQYRAYGAVCLMWLLGGAALAIGQSLLGAALLGLLGGVFGLGWLKLGRRLHALAKTSLWQE